MLPFKARWFHVGVPTQGKPRDVVPDKHSTRIPPLPREEGIFHVGKHELRQHLNLFGPGQDKQFFHVFDYCQNLEFFKENPQVSEGTLTDSLGARLFKRRLELIGEPDGGAIDKPLWVGEGAPEKALREDVAELLRTEVAATLKQATDESHGLGLFVRSLIGLDREAAKEAFGSFLTDKALSATQIEFINLIVNHLTEQGTMSADLLYESPFTDVSPTAPEGLFTPLQLDVLTAVLRNVEAAAVGN